MKILVRLPNWLGDMVMSVGFLKALQQAYPEAAISLIVKRGLHELLPFFPPHAQGFIFDKSQYKGIKGLRQFGRMVKGSGPFDLYFSLPDSFSTALSGFFTGASKRVGYNNEGRRIFLTHGYRKPKGLHRAEVYLHLLEQFTGKVQGRLEVRLQHQWQRQNHLIVNINSEASSRRLTTVKAIEIIASLRNATDRPIYLIGAPKERDFVEGVIKALPDRTNITSLAGTTSLPELCRWLATASALLTTDSGPAHLANALGTPTVVLFGAGDEHSTSPYIAELKKVIRLGQLSCEPCLKNHCVRFASPQCLERLHTPSVINALTTFLPS